MSTAGGDFPVGVSTNFTVPAGITSIDVVAVGAGGGAGDNGNMGGAGATVASTSIPVTPGDILKVMVGASGGASGAGSGKGGGGGDASGVVNTSGGVCRINCSRWWCGCGW